jgi:small subunit ribosomal protein S21
LRVVEGVRSKAREIVVHVDENFERALKRFKKKCEKAGILSDLRKHRHYEKPSERKKRKMNAARRQSRSGGHRTDRSSGRISGHSSRSRGSSGQR